MRILINGINFHPELTGIGKYTGEMAEWLVANGHEVRVITAPPYYPAWKTSKNYSGYRYKKELHGGIVVYRCPLWVPKKPGGITRIIHLISFAITSMPLVIANALFWKPDVIFITEPPLSCAPVVLFSSWISRSKSWLHIQDFEVDAAFELGIIKKAIPIQPIRTTDYPTPAKRPPYSVLDKTATWGALGYTASHWQINLQKMLQELGEMNNA